MKGWILTFYAHSENKSTDGQLPPRDTFLWAKTSKDNALLWHPLILHLIDVAVCAEEILEREPSATRDRMARIFDLPWSEAKPWLLLLVACHDLGKASPGFQLKWAGAKLLLDECGVKLPRFPDTSINHAFISQIALSELLQEYGWTQDLADLSADAVGCHHGLRAGPVCLDRLAGNRNALGDNDWHAIRESVFKSLSELFGAVVTPLKENLSGPDFMLLSGLTSFSDWIGSNEEYFRFGTHSDCNNLKLWQENRRKCATTALDSIGWFPRKTLSNRHQAFSDVFVGKNGITFSPRLLQKEIEACVKDIKEPCVLLVEAPMGEGKTEGAFYAYLELQRNVGHRGLYIALPTKATGNAMFERTLEFLNEVNSGRVLDLQLLHGANLLNDTFQGLKGSKIYNEDGEGSVRAGEWFTHKKRALLSEYGVGTVDQALLTILPVRHQFVRLWGLANRVVVFDEIHAYDTYTGTLLLHLIQWLHALGTTVILLSATLPPAFRRKLAEVMDCAFPEVEAKYPRLSIFQIGKMEQRHFEADVARRQEVAIKGINPDVETLHKTLNDSLSNGGYGLALVNTVQRAQNLYKDFPIGKPLERQGIRVGKILDDGTEVFLFHARFRADQRQVRENVVIEVFGRKGERTGKKILIATQVAEQSLDLDFDVMVTDLAPVDLLLQRAGRLWRHQRISRPVINPVLFVAGLAGDKPPSFGKPLWWKYVYGEDLLLKTWNLFHVKEMLMLPDEIDDLVRAVYDVEMSSESDEQLFEAECEGEGRSNADRGQAHQAFIGFPDDASWNDPARYVKADDDEVGLHPSLVAQTRLGEQSIIVIPISAKDGFQPEKTPDIETAKGLFMCSMALSRKDVVKKLKEIGVPKGWEKSALLRNCIPLVLKENGCWLEDINVRLDEELGLVYGMGKPEDPVK
jgi:CRISPR-associated endonuclease/helicase Cas3